MKRRRFLATAGALTGAASTVFGTGAFTSVRAERSVSISAAKDYRSFLRLEALVDEGQNDESTGRSYTDGDTVEFKIPGHNSGENSAAAGVGAESIYEFHDLMRVENHGTQPVQVYSTYNGNDLSDLALVNDQGVLREDPSVLDVGEGVDVGLYIDTHQTEIGEFDETLTIVADQPDE